MTLHHINPHIWWMPPAKPDRPSLCAVVGQRGTLMLDSGASDAHARLFLDALAAQNQPAPRLQAFTHWHWDHTFGAAEVGAPVIAHRLTAQKVAEMASYSWDDEAMAQRVAAHTGIPTERGMADIQEEMPAPRQIRFAQVDILVDSTLTIDLGGVTCRIDHVGGDHAVDSCVMYMAEDSLLFLGDCLYDSIGPTRHYTPDLLFPLIDQILAYPAEQYIEGHTDTVMSRTELVALTDRMRAAGQLVYELTETEADPVLKAAAQRGLDAADEDFVYFVNAFLIGKHRA